MPVNTKIIKRRIKSITSTKKITKAMEMISAVKMRRAVANVLGTRSYANLAWDMLQEIASKTDIKHHPLLTRRPMKKVGIIFITSNRGFAGGFASRLLAETHRAIAEMESGRANPPLPPPMGDSQPTVDVILLGKRGRKIYSRFGHAVSAEYEKIDLTTKIEEILPIAQTVIRDYIAGKYDKVMVAYTDFISAIKQTPIIKQILPLVDLPPTLIEQDFSQEDGEAETDFGLLFEPDPQAALDILLPRLVEMQIYQAILESDASEHSARMLAMRNASDAADDMIKELQYNYNKARQAAITQEISEIMGGAAALD